MAKINKARVFVRRIQRIDLRIWDRRANRKIKIRIKTNENEHDAD